MELGDEYQSSGSEGGGYDDSYGESDDDSSYNSDESGHQSVIFYLLGLICLVY